MRNVLGSIVFISVAILSVAFRAPSQGLTAEQNASIECAIAQAKVAIGASALSQDDKNRRLRQLAVFEDLFKQNAQTGRISCSPGGPVVGGTSLGNNEAFTKPESQRIISTNPLIIEFCRYAGTWLGGETVTFDCAVLDFEPGDPLNCWFLGLVITHEGQRLNDDSCWYETERPNGTTHPSYPPHHSQPELTPFQMDEACINAKSERAAIKADIEHIEAVGPMIDAMPAGNPV